MPDPLNQDPNSQGVQTPTIPTELAEFIVKTDSGYGLVTVCDGEKKVVPLTDARVRLQKEGTADRRLAEATRLRDQNKTAIEYYGYSLEAMNGNTDAGRKALELIGIEPDDDEPANAQPTGNTNVTPTPSLDPQTAAGLKALGELTAQGIDLKTAFSMVVGSANETARTRAYNNLRQAALADPKVAEFVNNKANDARATEFLNDLYRSLDNAVASGEADGPQTYVRLTREVSEKYKRLGILGANPDKPRFSESLSQAIGLGQASSSADVDLDSLVSDKRPEPAPIMGGEPGEYSRNVRQRILWDLQNREAEKSLAG